MSSCDIKLLECEHPVKLCSCRVKTAADWNAVSIACIINTNIPWHFVFVSFFIMRNIFWNFLQRPTAIFAIIKLKTISMISIGYVCYATKTNKCLVDINVWPVLKNTEDILTWRLWLCSATFVKWMCSKVHQNVDIHPGLRKDFFVAVF